MTQRFKLEAILDLVEQRAERKAVRQLESIRRDLGPETYEQTGAVGKELDQVITSVYALAYLDGTIDAVNAFSDCEDRPPAAPPPAPARGAFSRICRPLRTFAVGAIIFALCVAGLRASFMPKPYHWSTIAVPDGLFLQLYPAGREHCADAYDVTLRYATAQGVNYSRRQVLLDSYCHAGGYFKTGGSASPLSVSIRPMRWESVAE